MRVLHVIGGGEFGGAERHILTLFRTIDPEEAVLEAVSLFEVPFAPIAREAGMRVTVIPMGNKLDLRVIFRLRHLLRTNEYGLVHTHGVRANLLGRLAVQGLGLPVVTTVHSLIFQDYPHPVSRALNVLSERLTSPLTAHFITVSNYLAASLIKSGVPRQKITVVYNGMDLRPGTAKPQTLRERYSVPEGAPLIATVGRLHRVKGHRYFVEAAALVLERYPEACFLIIGSGPERALLEDKVDRLGLRGSVFFTGFIKDVERYYPEFQALVLASLSEGLPLTVLEALAGGVPVVATRAGGLPEVIQDRETGLLVPPVDVTALAEAIMRILENPAEAQEMVRKGRDFVGGNFSAARMAAGTMAVYRRVLGINA
ncbi:MAG: glycosyltransferase family 1 protein [Ammonifex sp.]|nr:MAG: glycosyltransferase family 1 protein [Ammonifex sp.]